MGPPPEGRRTTGVPPGSDPAQGADAVVRPLRRDARRNREVVLEAARRMFAEHGAACAFEDIAREAGVGVGTVYRRFPDRRALIEAILEQRIADVDRVAAESLSLDEPWAAVTVFVGSAARMQLEDRGLRELLHDDGFVSAGLALLRQRLTPAAEDLAARLRVDGAARPDLNGTDLLVLIRMLGSLTRDQADAAPAGAAGARRTDTGAADGPPGGFDRYLGLLLDGIRHVPDVYR